MEEAKTAEKKAKPRYNTLQNVWWMIRRAAATNKLLLPIAAMQIVSGVSLAMLELFSGPAILRQVTNGSLPRLLGTVALFCGGLMAAGALDSYLQCNAMFSRVGTRIGIINDLTCKYCRTSYVHIEQPDFCAAASSAYQAGGGNDGPLEGIWDRLVTMSINLLNFIVYLMLLVRLDTVLLIVTVGAALLAHLGAQTVERWQRMHESEEDRLFHRVGYFEQNVKDAKLAKDIRIFGMGVWLETLYQDAMRLLDHFHVRVQRRGFAADALKALLDLARNGVAYAWLLGAVAQGGLDAAGFLLYFGAVSGLAGWLAGLFGHLEKLNDFSREISHLREWLETPEPFRFEDGADIPRPADGRYTIELRDVSYRYPGAAKDVISHLNLTLAPGEKLAVVGLNGAGKTTLIKLLCGFLDPDEGAVLLNGADIRQYNRRQYYALFGAVFQKVSVLPASVAENVSQQTEEEGVIDRDRVAACLEQAGLAAYIRTLPQGIDTKLGREVYLDAVQLSGGQEQRLMLARALYKDAPITVLDEPTAALDPLAESDLYQKYGQMTAGHSAVYISHRLASTRFCDRIILLENGSIAECGTHDALIAADGKYAELFRVQSRYYQENPGASGEEESSDERF